jgi:hypothetical protein
MQTLNEQARDIMSRFDFARVQQTMEALKWTWRGDAESPSIPDLISTADDVIRWAVTGYTADMPFYSSSTGGFTARVLRYDSGAKLELSFEVERRSCY